MRIATLSAFLLATVVVPADLVRIDRGKITFEVPAGFNQLPQDVVDRKWPAKQAPRFVVGTEGGTTTIDYDLKPYQLPADKLPEVRKSFTKQFERVVPGIVWKRNEIVQLAGRKWICFEMTSTAVDTDIHNMTLMTGFEGQMLVFNFNSTREAFPRVEKALRKSMNSIRFGARGKKRKNR